jgi:hypothetical protein
MVTMVDGGAGVAQIDAGLHRSSCTWMAAAGWTEPPKASVLQTGADGKLMKDEFGNGLGGVRSPDLDVPIRTLSADPAPMSDFICFLFGSTTPFTPERLLELYPTHEDYVTKVTASAQKLRSAGFLLEPEATAYIEAAETARVPK